MRRSDMLIALRSINRRIGKREKHRHKVEVARSQERLKALWCELIDRYEESDPDKIEIKRLRDLCKKSLMEYRP